MHNILIRGAGIAGLTTAFALQEKGHIITVVAPEEAPMHSASWYAGGMLAPYCERENAEQIVEDLGVEAIKWWEKHFPHLLSKNGTLVVAPQRDEADLLHFLSKTQKHQFLSEEEIAKLEPDLKHRFSKALFYTEEAHLDPRKALLALKASLLENDVLFFSEATFQSNNEKQSFEKDFNYIINTTGIARLNEDKDLRGVRGEMVLLKTNDVHFSRSIRLLHPRIPIYVVPRGDNIYMIGATMIESTYNGKISARSIMEFLNAAYTLHPAFAEAEILETGVGIRPAYCDNFPHIIQQGKYLYLNGFYRHGFLLAPHMAKEICQKINDKGRS